MILSKTLDPADYAELADELQVVDLYFTSAREQHPMRRWEYAMALKALTQWRPPDGVTHVADVGGGGSPFKKIVEVLGTKYRSVTIVDPEVNTDLRTYVQLMNPPLCDAVFCLSVLEHVDDLPAFLYHLSCLVAPGGLLFLTMDVQEHSGPDDKHFHWMRKRIFSCGELTYWARPGLPVAQKWCGQFQLLGSDFDYTWQGPQVYDYSFASLALVKNA